MGNRTATLLGTDGSDYINTSYTDRNGNSIGMFADDDATQVQSDQLTVLAGDGADSLFYRIPQYEGHPSDDFDIDMGAGHDGVYLNNSIGAAGSSVRIDGGAGDDRITYIGPSAATLIGGAGNDYIAIESMLPAPFDSGDAATPVLSGGEGYDIFDVLAYNSDDSWETWQTRKFTITDFEVGVDQIRMMLFYTNYVDFYSTWREEADEFGTLTLTDTDAGLVLGFMDWNPSVEWYLAYEITLVGVTEADLRAVYQTTVHGTDGNDRIDQSYVDAIDQSLTDAANVIRAGAGNDMVWLNGGTGADTVLGEAGHDNIRSRDGDNLLLGGDGRDILTAMRGASTLDGEAGDDRLYAAANSGSHHVLTGGEGADSFHIISTSATRSSTVTITDFDEDEDSLFILGQAIDIRDLPSDIDAGTDADGWLVLHLPDDETVTLVGVTVADEWLA